MNEKKYVLPNGTVFSAWSDETEYKKVIHVSQKNGSENM